MGELPTLFKPNLSETSWVASSPAVSPNFQSSDNLSTKPEAFNFYVSGELVMSYFSYQSAESTYYEGVNLSQSQFMTIQTSVGFGVELPFGEKSLLRPHGTLLYGQRLKHKFDLETEQGIPYDEYQTLSHFSWFGGMDILFFPGKQRSVYVGAGPSIGIDHYLILRSFEFQNGSANNDEEPDIQSNRTVGRTLLGSAQAIAGTNFDEITSVELQFRFAKGIFFPDTLMYNSIGIAYHRKFSSEIFQRGETRF